VATGEEHEDARWGFVDPVALDPTGRTVAEVPPVRSRKLKVYEGGTRKERFTIPGHYNPWEHSTIGPMPVYSPDGPTLAVLV
jgi:hypothetical protein